MTLVEQLRMPCGVCKSNDLNETLLTVNAKCRTCFGVAFDLPYNRSIYWHIVRYSTLESHSSLWRGLRLDQSQVELYTTYTIYCSVRSKTKVRHLSLLSRACHSNRSIIDATGHAQLLDWSNYLPHILRFYGKSNAALESLEASYSASDIETSTICCFKEATKESWV